MSTRSGTLALFVLDNSGRVLAASNWRRNDSSVGEDMSQRPYFVEAMNGGQGQFYGLDSLSGEPGYYLSSPLAHRRPHHRRGGGQGAPEPAGAGLAQGQLQRAGDR